MTIPKIKIDTAQIKAIVSLRETVAATRKTLRKTEADLEELETAMKDKLKEGALVDSKTYVAVLAMEEGVCRPAWREHFLNHMLSIHDVTEKKAEEDARAFYPAQPRELLSISLVKKE